MNPRLAPRVLAAIDAGTTYGTAIVRAVNGSKGVVFAELSDLVREGLLTRRIETRTEYLARGHRGRPRVHYALTAPGAAHLARTPETPDQSEPAACRADPSTFRRRPKGAARA